MKPLLLSLLLLGLLSGLSAAKIDLGIDVLAASKFKALQGKRVGLLTNPAGVNKHGVSTLDVLWKAPEVNLIALFGPEHGIYGKALAEVHVKDGIDQRTGLPTYSLYGKTRRPTDAMLKGLDSLVIDLQDLGVRSYTYVSCMKYVMEECMKRGIEVVVLDRPNPIGGLKIDGPPLNPEWTSYVGAWPVPYVHGLTIGELARMGKRIPGWLDINDETRKQGRLVIVPMKGWKRDMLWSDTGLKWVATSPAIQDLSSAMGYAMTGLGAQLGKFSHGYGTDWAFRLLTFGDKPASEILTALKARQIPGLDFRLIRYRNKYGEPREGVYVLVTDWRKLRPTEISFHMMQLACLWQQPNPFSAAPKNLQRLYNKHVGSTAWWNEISQRGANARVSYFVEKWARQCEQFGKLRKPFLIY